MYQVASYLQSCSSKAIAAGAAGDVAAVADGGVVGVGVDADGGVAVDVGGPTSR